MTLWFCIIFDTWNAGKSVELYAYELVVALVPGTRIIIELVCAVCDDALRHDQELLQGQWDAGQFGIATVTGCKVSYSSLAQKFDLFRTKDCIWEDIIKTHFKTSSMDSSALVQLKDNLLVLGEYRASLHESHLYWRIPEDPSEETVHWAKLQITEIDKIEIQDSDEGQEIEQEDKQNVSKRTSVMRGGLMPLQDSETIDMCSQTSGDRIVRPKRRTSKEMAGDICRPSEGRQVTKRFCNRGSKEILPQGAQSRKTSAKSDGVTLALRPLLAPLGTRTCAVCCAVMHSAVELKQAAAFHHLVCDVCACPAQSGHEFWVPRL